MTTYRQKLTGFLYEDVFEDLEGILYGFFPNEFSMQRIYQEEEYSPELKVVLENNPKLPGMGHMSTVLRLFYWYRQFFEVIFLLAVAAFVLIISYNRQDSGLLRLSQYAVALVNTIGSFIVLYSQRASKIRLEIHREAQVAIHLGMQRVDKAVRESNHDL